MADEDSIAEPHPCVRCSQDSFLAIVGRCADCIGDMGLRHPDEHAAWKVEVGASIVRG